MADATRAELKARMEELEVRNGELVEERDLWRREKISDDEAAAMSKCAKALDTLAEAGKSRSSYSLNVGGYAYTEWGNPKMRRILRYLADRYGVQWFEPPVDDVLRSAVDAVLNEWNIRGDGGCVTRVQDQLRDAYQRTASRG